MEHEWYFASEGSKTLLVAPDSRWFRSGRLVDKILETHPEERDRILVLGAVHTPVIRDWSVREADLVRFDSDPFSVHSVSRLTDPDLVRNRLDFTEDIVEGIALEHATVEVPITVLGDTTTFLIRALAPHGLGVKAIYTGESKTGKTWTMRRVLKAYRRVAEQGLIDGFSPKNTDWVVLNVGERVTDVRETRETVLEASPSTGSMTAMLSRRIANTVFTTEHFVGFTTPVAVKNARFCQQRTHRLVETAVVMAEELGQVRHLVFVVDSIWGLMQALTQAEKEGGLAGKGISREALRQGQQFLFAGQLPVGGTVTLLITCLHEGPGSGSEVVYKEIGGNLVTVEARHRAEWDPSTARPWLDFIITNCRETAKLFGDDVERERLHSDFKHRALEVGEGNPGRALGYLRKLAEEIGWNPPAIHERWEEEDKKQDRKPHRTPRERRDEVAVELPPIEAYIELGEELVAEGLLVLGIGRIDAKALRDDKGLTPDEVREQIEETGELPL